MVVTGEAVMSTDDERETALEDGRLEADPGVDRTEVSTTEPRLMPAEEVVAGGSDGLRAEMLARRADASLPRPAALPRPEASLARREPAADASVRGGLTSGACTPGKWT